MTTTKKKSRDEHDHSFLIRCRPDEIAAFRKAAEAKRLPLSTWARTTLMELLRVPARPLGGEG